MSEIFDIGTGVVVTRFHREPSSLMEGAMGKGLLLWLIGIPIPIIVLVWLLGGLN